MLALREVTMSAIFIRIMTAMALGGIIGMERGINQYSYQATGTGDPVRMGAQVVSGIGFLGAGTIIVTAHNRIKGLTTAAGLWASACVGLAVGIGLYEVALVSGASIFLVLTLLHRSELGLRRRSNVVEFYVELDPHVPLGSFLRSAKSCGLELNGILKEYDSGYGEDSLAFMVTIRGKKNLHRDEIIQTVRQFEGIRHLEPL